MTFNEWFEAQFGPTPDVNMTISELMDECASAQIALSRWETRLAARQDYEHWKNGAIKAWAAADRAKKITREEL